MSWITRGTMPVSTEQGYSPAQVLYDYYRGGQRMSDFTDTVLVALVAHPGGSTAPHIASYLKARKGDVSKSLVSLQEQGLVEGVSEDEHGDIVYTVANPHVAS